MDAQGLEFAQQEESEHVIEIGIRERYAGDGGVAHTLSRVQFGRGFDLRAQVWRCA
jgi:hypothetical protein